MRLAICIMHAAFEPKRRETLAKLLERLGVDADIVPPVDAGDGGFVCSHCLLDPDTQLWVVGDQRRAGAWACARRCWEVTLYDDVDWIIILNDDALPCDGFVEVARKALASRSRRDPVCFYAAHPQARAVYDVLKGSWYTTHDDLVGVGCALSRESAREFLFWVDANPNMNDASDDGRINLWAIATGLLVHTTVPSLVDHQLPEESTVEWSSPDARTAVVPPESKMEMLSWEPTFANPRPCVPHLGRKRAGNHWEMLHRVSRVTPELIERAYLVQRHGVSVSSRPHVFVAMPAARAPELAVRISVDRVRRDLEQHGIDCTVFESPGDSLVTRARHALCHEFLCSTATHMLQWDDDVEILDASAVRRMLGSEHDIVGCAYPWRDGSGRVVCNPLPETVERQYVDFDGHHCARVAEVGTGFLMTSRECLVDLMARNPEDMYQADIEPYVGAPMWALFDARLEQRGPRRRYASEDWRFCSIARVAGYDVWVYYPPVLRHWGKKAHEGHITKAWGMGETRQHFKEAP